MVSYCCSFVCVIIACFAFAVPLIGSEIGINPPPPFRKIELIEITQAMDQVLFLMQKWLATMHEVARWKWNQKIEIEDIQQEKQTTAKFVKLAAAYGLNKEWAAAFFSAQIEAGKMIQLRDFEYWSREEQGEFGDAADLPDEIRPYLDRLSKELLQALVEIDPRLKEGVLEAIIMEQPPMTRGEDHVDEDVWLQAVAPLYEYGS